MSDQGDDKTAKTRAAENQDGQGEDLCRDRRDFLIGLGRWSRAVIAGAVVTGGTLLGEKPAEAGWLNRRGGGGRGWINGRGGGGAWVNRRGGFGGSWVNAR